MSMDSGNCIESDFQSMNFWNGTVSSSDRITGTHAKKNASYKCTVHAVKPAGTKQNLLFPIMRK
eukprot:4714994-Amphidinium_carterae.1